MKAYDTAVEVNSDGMWLPYDNLPGIRCRCSSPHSDVQIPFSVIIYEYRQLTRRSRLDQGQPDD